MRLDCPRCGRVLEYTDKRPSFCAYCGKPLTQPVDLTAPHDLAEAATLPPCEPELPRRSCVPDCIGGYRLVRALGTGGMGTVYEALEITTERAVALKLISPDYAGSEETVARFRQEGRLASQVVHPRCVFVHNADEEAGLPYIVMELMPGETLQDLVQKRGPLPTEEAVTKILDVIDGLQEAHRVGIIHRDVKPSNCFLEADGRVKVGDFGLSRSLINDARLTRTGAFLGTPLYASPEQIRADPVDQQTDLYSVAATLYFLLTGRAPHQTGDAAATMARIVCEDAPSMRETRPELSATLDGVVLQGLERDRGQRWANLEEFRQALVPFAPGRLPAAGFAPRFAAFFVDCLTLGVGIGLVYFLFIWAISGSPAATFGDDTTLTREGHRVVVAERAGVTTAERSSVASVGLHLVGTVLWILYFALIEGIWGVSPGKWLFGLKVVTASGCDPPGVLRAALRAAVLEFCFFFGSHLETFVYDPLIPPLETGAIMFDWRGWVLAASAVVGPLLPWVTSRARNGGRGLHEWLSGTRVISSESREPPLGVPSRRWEQEVTRPAGLPERLGPYLVLGVLDEGAGDQILLGQDPALGRKAVIWLRPAGADALPPERHELARGTRLRWLSNGCHDNRPWDAFVAPSGCSLDDLVARHGRLSWADARPLLKQLTNEVAAASAEDSLPPAPGTGHVWVLPDGRVCLLDFHLGASDDRRATSGLMLVRDVAVLTLEGRLDDLDQPTSRIRAPLPESVVPVLGRLVDPQRPYEQVSEWQDALSASRHRPGRVTPAARLAHLEVLTLALAVGLTCTYLFPIFLFFERALGPFMRSQVLEQIMVREASATYSVAVFAVNPDPFLALVLLRARTGATGPLIVGRRGELGPFLFFFLPHRSEAGMPTPFLDRLEELAFRSRQQHEARMRSLSWPLRKVVWLNAPSPDDIKLDDWVQDFILSSAGHPSPDENVALYFLVLSFPVLWVVWAFAFRGGLSYRLSGLALVRSDGRPAARWQFGFRALLIWGPVAGLLALSVWLDNWFVARFLAGDAPAWIPWLSWGSWWLAVLLPPAFALLALWRPERSLHDRFVGTYLVPR